MHPIFFVLHYHSIKLQEQNHSLFLEVHEAQSKLPRPHRDVTAEHIVNFGGDHGSFFFVLIVHFVASFVFNRFDVQRSLLQVQHNVVAQERLVHRQRIQALAEGLHFLGSFEHFSLAPVTTLSYVFSASKEPGFVVLGKRVILALEPVPAQLGPLELPVKRLLEHLRSVIFLPLLGQQVLHFLLAYVGL